MLNKKSQSSYVVVSFIILVIAIVAVILIYKGIFLDDDALDQNREICHSSVVLRTAPGGEKLIPLECQTENVCVASSKLLGLMSGKCEKFELEKNQVKIKVGSSGDEKEKEIKRAIADRMYRCWDMMGQGKLNFMDRNGVWDFNCETYCFICSDIEFDDSINEEFKVVISENQENNNAETIGGIRNFAEFLRDEKISEDKGTYMQAFTENPDMNSWGVATFYETQNSNIVTEEKNVDIIDPAKGLYVIYMVEKEGTITSSHVLGGLGVSTGAVAVGLLGGPVSWTAMVGGIAYSAVYSYISKGDDNGYNVLLIPKDVEYLKKLKCSSFETYES